MKAIWNGVVLAESADTIVVEGNHYFPADSVNREYLKSSDMYSICPWKGRASYYTLDVNGETNQDAAWYYPEPRDMAKELVEGRVAFWRGVQIVES